MDRRIVSAVFISIVLIGGATWVRLASAHKTGSGVVSVNNVDVSTDPEHDDFWYKNIFSNSEATSTSLTNTDILGRQLIFDFVDQTATGKTSDADIDALADQYVSKLPQLLSGEKVELINIKAVANTSANLQAYSTAMGSALSSYQANMKKVAPNGPSELGSGLYSKTQAMSDIYLSTANKLKVMPVPMSIAPTHVELVNIYFENASALEAISKTDSDPAQAFSGVITLNNNLDRENALVQKISTALGNI